MSEHGLFKCGWPIDDRWREYVQHKPDCERVRGTRYTHQDDWGHLSYKYRVPGDKCTCGLDALLKRVVIGDEKQNQ